MKLYWVRPINKPEGEALLGIKARGQFVTFTQAGGLSEGFQDTDRFKILSEFEARPTGAVFAPKRPARIDNILNPGLPEPEKEQS